MSLDSLKQDWEELSRLDPCWAVLTELPKGQSGQQDIEAFFRTGQEEIAGLMDVAGRLGYPLERDLALDFGCGLGRLSRALAAHFRRCVGLDISENMLAQARLLNQPVSNVEFVVNTAPHLHRFPDAHFDLVYTARVLQHLPGPPAIRAYLAEFVRVLKPAGLLAFQLPSHIPLRKRLQPRRRLYALLRRFGAGERFLFARLGLVPMQMCFISEINVVRYMSALGAELLEVQPDQMCGPAIQSRTYYVTKR